MIRLGHLMIISRYKATISALLLTTASTGPAEAAAFLSPDLRDLSTFSATSMTAGAGTRVYGNVLSGLAMTTDVGVHIYGSAVSAGAVTVGASSQVSGTVVSGAGLTVGAGSIVGGGLTSGAATAIGAAARVGGDVLAGAAATTGDAAIIAGSVQSGAAVDIAANSKVVGYVAAIGAITIGADGSAGTQQSLTASPIDTVGLTVALGARVNSTAGQIRDAQSTLASFRGAQLGATIDTDRTFTAGVYNVAGSLTTTAGTTITLDAQGKADQLWVFNIADTFTTGADTNIFLINAPMGGTVLWTAGGFASLGARSVFSGLLLATGYITVGANTSALGGGIRCGSLLSSAGYVSLGANSGVGTAGCQRNGFRIASDGSQYYTASSEVPEPATWAMLIAGYGIVVGAMRWRRSAITLSR